MRIVSPLSLREKKLNGGIEIYIYIYIYFFCGLKTFFGGVKHFFYFFSAVQKKWFGQNISIYIFSSFLIHFLFFGGFHNKMGGGVK